MPDMMVLFFQNWVFGTFKKEPYKEENYTFDYKRP